MVAYSVNFNLVPLGPFTHANKLTAWQGATIDSDADPNGTFFTIVSGGLGGGQCCQMKYGAGLFGEGNQFYSIPLGAPGVPMVTQFDILFVPGFDMSRGSGKIAPLLIWGGRSGANGGTDTMVIWESAVTTNPKRYNPVFQNQQSPSSFPSELIAPVIYTPTNIVPGQWDTWRTETMGGPGGYVKFARNGVNIPVAIASTGNTLAGNSIKLEVGFWAGGGAANAPLVDSYTLQTNIQVFSIAPPPPPVSDFPGAQRRYAGMR